MLELTLLRVDCMWTSDAGVNPCLCSQWNCASLMLRTSCSAQVTSYASMLGRTQLPSLPRQARLVVCNVSAANATQRLLFFKSSRKVASELGQVYLGAFWRFGGRSGRLPVRLLLTPRFLGICCCSRHFLQEIGSAQTLTEWTSVRLHNLDFPMAMP